MWKTRNAEFLRLKILRRKHKSTHTTLEKLAGQSGFDRLQSMGWKESDTTDTVLTFHGIWYFPVPNFVLLFGGFFVCFFLTYLAVTHYCLYCFCSMYSLPKLIIFVIILGIMNPPNWVSVHAVHIFLLDVLIVSFTFFQTFSSLCTLWKVLFADFKSLEAGTEKVLAKNKEILFKTGWEVISNAFCFTLCFSLNPIRASRYQL